MELNEFLLFAAIFAAGFLVGHMFGWAARGRNQTVPQPVRDAKRRIDLRGRSAIRRNDTLCDSEITEDSYGALESEELV